MSISKVMVKNVHRAAKDVGASEISMGATSLGPHFFGAQATGPRRQLVVHPDSIIHCKGPKSHCNVGGLMAHRVQKIGTCPADDDLDITFRNAVLKLGRDTAEGVFLKVLITVVLESLGQENAIVRMIFLDSKSLLLSQRLEIMFTLQSIVSLGRELTVVEDLLTSVVDHEGTTGVTSHFASVGIGKLAIDRRNVVIGRNIIPREHIAPFENHTVISPLKPFREDFTKLDLLLLLLCTRLGGFLLFGARCLDVPLCFLAGSALEVTTVNSVRTEHRTRDERTLVQGGISIEVAEPRTGTH